MSLRIDVVSNPLAFTAKGFELWYTFDMKKLPKLHKGDKVAIVSPSFAASAVWPHVHELGLKRIREVFELEPVVVLHTKQRRVTYHCRQ